MSHMKDCNTKPQPSNAKLGLFLLHVWVYPSVPIILPFKIVCPWYIELKGDWSVLQYFSVKGETLASQLNPLLHASFLYVCC
jgi:hypothetical protein